MNSIPIEAKEYLQKAYQFEDQHQLEAALDACTAALRLAPEWAEVYNFQGIILEQLDRPEEAESAYTTAIRLDPELKEAQDNLNELQAEQRAGGEAARPQLPLNSGFPLKSWRDLLLWAVLGTLVLQAVSWGLSQLNLAIATEQSYAFRPLLTMLGIFMKALWGALALGAWGRRKGRFGEALWVGAVGGIMGGFLGTGFSLIQELLKFPITIPWLPLGGIFLIPRIVSWGLLGLCIGVIAGWRFRSLTPFALILGRSLGGFLFCGLTDGFFASFMVEPLVTAGWEIDSIYLLYQASSMMIWIMTLILLNLDLDLFRRPAGPEFKREALLPIQP